LKTRRLSIESGGFSFLGIYWRRGGHFSSEPAEQTTAGSSSRYDIGIREVIEFFDVRSMRYEEFTTAYFADPGIMILVLALLDERLYVQYIFLLGDKRSCRLYRSFPNPYRLSPTGNF
jgi:hypothetical protein